MTQTGYLHVTCDFSRPVSALLQSRPMAMVTEPTKRLADCSRGGSSKKDAPVINNLSEKATSQKSYHLITILAWGFIQLCS